MTLSTIPCVRCGRSAAYSETQCLRFHQRSGPPLQAGICPLCTMQDPLLRAQIDAWSERNRAQLVQGIRDILARPLEAIDRFVARFE